MIHVYRRYQILCCEKKLASDALSFNSPFLSNAPLYILRIEFDMFMTYPIEEAQRRQYEGHNTSLGYGTHQGP